jgi:hypothetical protein
MMIRREPIETAGKSADTPSSLSIDEAIAALMKTAGMDDTPLGREITALVHRARAEAWIEGFEAAKAVVIAKSGGNIQ